MLPSALMLSILVSAPSLGAPPEPSVIAKPEAFPTLVNPQCSHCKDEAKRRASELKDSDRVLCWLRGYSEGGAIPMRFFLSRYRVISDSYGLFVYDPDAGFARGFAPSYDFRFHGWRKGVMVMQHADGTLYSCLTGVAFAGPRKGDRLKPVATLVSDWGFWLEHYPNAVAYHMFDKYQPVDLPCHENRDAVQSRDTPDPRLRADEVVLGVSIGSAAQALPVAALEAKGLIACEVGGEPVVLLWEPRTRTASAFRPIASQPRKYKGPQPDAHGVSPPDEGVLVPPGAAKQEPRKLTLSLAAKPGAGRFVDAQTQSLWDVAGRCVEGKLKGWTLEWVDSVQVKWFAWAAEYPQTTLYGAREKQAADPNKQVKEIAGTAEFLRMLPKPLATIEAVDPPHRTVTLLIDGEKGAKVWPVEADAELKVAGWWGRLEEFQPKQRVWAWLKLDRKKNPISVVMLADEITEWDMHGGLRTQSSAKPKFAPEEVEAQRSKQQAWLRQQWIRNGLPGTLTFQHVFSGELEIALDHEAMRWARSLAAGDIVHLTVEPPIKAVVKAVTPWRERTVVRLVVGELESSELRIGQRLGLKMTPPSEEVATSLYPPDLDRPRSKSERVEWFLASIYCTCGVDKDVCTGHFYTLASCNPNGCGMPNATRGRLSKMIDEGWSDRRIFDELLKERGALLLRPHLRP
jgi:hypothetical protein